MFAGLPDEPTTWHRAAGKVALRFPDPLRRTDSAGRVIPHEFVVYGELAEEIDSVEDGVRRVWPLVDEAYARVWDADGPPSAADLGLASQRHAPSDADRHADGDPERTAPS